MTNKHGECIKPTERERLLMNKNAIGRVQVGVARVNIVVWFCRITTMFQHLSMTLMIVFPTIIINKKYMY